MVRGNAPAGGARAREGLRRCPVSRDAYALQPKGRVWDIEKAPAARAPGLGRTA